MVPGWARKLELAVVALTLNPKPALPGPGQFGLFTFEMKIFKEI